MLRAKARIDLRGHYIADAEGIAALMKALDEGNRTGKAKR